MKLNWAEHESGFNEAVEAYGTGKRYYSVWKECNQFIADVDDLQIGYGSKQHCMKLAQMHEDSIDL